MSSDEEFASLVAALNDCVQQLREVGIGYATRLFSVGDICDGSLLCQFHRTLRKAY